MSFLSSIWDAITYIPRQVTNIARSTVGGALEWGSNVVGGVLQNVGVTSVQTPWGGFTVGGQPTPQAPTTYFGTNIPPVQPSGANWSKILLYGGIAVVGILVIVIVLKMVKK